MKRKLTFTPCNLDEVRSNDYWTLINEFQDANITCAVVNLEETERASVVTANINRACKNYNRYHIKAETIKGKTYLINTLLENKK